MHKLLLSFVAAGTLAVATVPASAMPGAQPLPLASATPGVTLVWGGCGPYGHPTPFGCRPNFGGYGYGYRRPFFGWHRRFHHW